MDITRKLNLLLFPYFLGFVGLLAFYNGIIWLAFSGFLLAFLAWVYAGASLEKIKAAEDLDSKWWHKATSETIAKVMDKSKEL